MSDQAELRVPSVQDSELAKTASRILSQSEDELTVRLEHGEELKLPRSVTPFLVKILTEMSEGNAVTVIPVHAELSTQEAANILNVSRPHLIKLLKKQEIPCHMVGSHRRVKFQDLEAYRRQFETQREDALQELADQAQELGLGY